MNISTGVPQWSQSSSCTTGSCPSDTCPDFVIKRHDTYPPFKVSLQTCTGLPASELDNDYLLAEVNIWAKAKLKTAITASDTYFAFADNTGFDQMLPGDIIVMDRVRLPEQMLVIGFDEINKLVLVSRGYNNTEACAWSKGSNLKIFRVRNASAAIEKEYQDIINVDGTTSTDQLVASYLVYDWQPNDTCVPGCFMLEFKLLQMISNVELGMLTASVIPSFTPSTISITDFGCVMGQDVEWVRRYPQTQEGFLIQVIDSPTSE